VEEEDIIDLEKRYWKLHSTSRTGKMDLETLFPLVSPPLPESIVRGFMDAFDENRDGHIDFKEMACGISAAGRGPALERQKCKLFKLCWITYSVIENTLLLKRHYAKNLAFKPQQAIKCSKRFSTCLIMCL